jgi:hypothetical protein
VAVAMINMKLAGERNGAKFTEWEDCKQAMEQD